jgi:succinyl-diaminopimelate desuccinylase
VVTESKGICHARLTATGRAAHAAYPWLGRNALLSITDAIARLLAAYPVPVTEAWTTTVNVARLETANRAYNQVPAQASAWLDIRFPPSDPDFAGRTAEQVAAHLSTIAGVEARVAALGPPHRADPAGPGVTALRTAIRSTGHPASLLRKHGAADSRYYHALGIDAVIFGPGGDGQHGPAEYVDVPTLRPYHDALVAFLQTFDG